MRHSPPPVLRLDVCAPSKYLRSHAVSSVDLVWWPDEEDRFAAYLTDDEPPELAFYCSNCAEREFKS